MMLRSRWTILAVLLVVGGCTSAHRPDRLQIMGEQVNAADPRWFRSCAPVEWADVTDHYKFAVKDFAARRFRSAAHHLDIAEAQYAKALELVKSCPPGGRNPSFRVP